jgi:hypothetical protein
LEMLLANKTKLSSVNINKIMHIHIELIYSYHDFFCQTS